MRHANTNYGRSVGFEGCFEGLLYLFLCVGGHSDTAESLSGCDDIESGQIERGYIGSFFKNRKLFENGVLVVARNDVNELEFLPSGRIEALYRILKRPIADGSDDRPSGSQLLLGNCNANRRRFSPPEYAARKGVVRARLGDWPALGEISEIRSRLVHQNRIGGAQLAQCGECLKGRQGAIRRRWKF